MDWRKSEQRGKQWWAWLLLLLLSGWPVVTTAHGSGTPHLVNVAAGPYQIWVWSSPDPVRLGEMHFSVAVAEPDAGRVDLTVQIDLKPMTPVAEAFTVQTVKYTRWLETYYETDFVIPATGDWRATVQVTGPSGNGEAAFAFTVLPPPAVNWTLLSWGVLAVVALLGGLWVKRGDQHSAQRPT